jgi:hypothetical protein
MRLKKCEECDKRYAILRACKNNQWKDFCLVCTKNGKYNIGCAEKIDDKKENLVVSFPNTNSTNADETYPFIELKAIEEKLKSLTQVYGFSEINGDIERCRNIISMKSSICNQLQKMMDSY